MILFILYGAFKKEMFVKGKNTERTVITQMFCNLRSQTFLGQQIILKISKLSALKR